VTAQELKDIMHTYRLTGADIAEICHVSQSAVYSWRIGRKQMSRQSVALLQTWLEGVV